MEDAPHSSYGYDWAQRLTSVTLPTGFAASTTATFGWRLDGLVASRSWSAGTAFFAYDGAKRPTGITKGSITQSQTTATATSPAVQSSSAATADVSWSLAWVTGIR